MAKPAPPEVPRWTVRERPDGAWQAVALTDAERARHRGQLLLDRAGARALAEGRTAYLSAHPHQLLPP